MQNIYCYPISRIEIVKSKFHTIWRVIINTCYNFVCLTGLSDNLCIDDDGVFVEFKSWRIISNYVLPRTVELPEFHKTTFCESLDAISPETNLDLLGE